MTSRPFRPVCMRWRQKAVDGIHIAEQFGLEGAGLFFLVEGDGELLQPFHEGAAEIELHVAQRAAHEPHKTGVNERILQEQQKIAAGDPEDFGKRAAIGEDIHDHAHGEWHERGGRLLDDVQGHGPGNAAMLVVKETPERAAGTFGVESAVEQFFPGRARRG